MFDLVEQGDFTDAEFRALVAQAQELSIQYYGDDSAELHALVQLAMATKGDAHPVPCFGQSYDPINRGCRICTLRDRCADIDKKPRVELVSAKLQAVVCESCARGMLEVAVEDDAGNLRDFACTTAGCQNTVAVQCGWESVGNIVPVEVVLPAKKTAEVKADSSDPNKPYISLVPAPSAEPLRRRGRPAKKIGRAHV